jgi:hypothetical protein
MLLIVIWLTRANLGIRTYPDLSLQIAGFLMGGCLYMQIGRPEIPAMVWPVQKPSPAQGKQVKVKGLRAILEVKDRRYGAGLI